MPALGIQLNRNKITHAGVALLFVLSSLLVLVRPISVSAAQITSRSLDISSSDGGATGVTYTFTFTVPSSTVLQSFQAEICTTASGSCTTPTGWTGASADLASQPTNYGDASGWTDASTATALKMAKTGNTAAPSGSQTVAFSGVTNPTADNGTFFARITTYSDDAYSTAVDSGVVAGSTAAQINFTASVDETLVFCTGTSGITNSSCTGATGSSVAFGTLSSSSAKTGTSQIGIGTNAPNGFAITVNGSTLTCGACSGSPTITANATPATYSVGTEQFGMNMVANTSPSSFGANPSGSGDSVPSADYDTDGEFTFVTGASIVSDVGDSEAFRLFTASYMAGIAANTEAGAYTATFTYIATATF